MKKKGIELKIFPVFQLFCSGDIMEKRLIRIPKKGYFKSPVLGRFTALLEGHIRAKAFSRTLEKNKGNYKRKSMLLIREILFSFQLNHKRHLDTLNEVISHISRNSNSYETLYYSVSNLKVILSSSAKFFPYETLNLVKTLLGKTNNMEKDLYYLAGLFKSINRITHYDVLLRSLLHMVKSNSQKHITTSLIYLYDTAYKRNKIIKANNHVEVFIKKVVPLLEIYKDIKLVNALYITMHLANNKISSPNFEENLHRAIKGKNYYLKDVDRNEFDRLLGRFKN